MKTIKVGDFVYSKYDGATGVVIEINYGDPTEPFSVSNHGCINLQIIDKGKTKIFPPTNSYVLYDWQNILNIITEEVKIENLKIKLHEINKKLIFQ